MEIQPLIASYISQSANAIRQILNSSALNIVAWVAEAPIQSADLDPILRDELIEMHVSCEQDGLVWIDTSVFFEKDIQRANDFAIAFGEALADRVIPTATALLDTPPAIRNFLVGIVAIGQFLHQTMQESGLAANWPQWGGRYARSKVDFEQVCEVTHRLGPDLHSKGIERGLFYTAVLLGPGGPGYYLKPSEIANPATREYIGLLDRFLTDAFPMFLTGELDHPALQEAAGNVGLLKNGLPEPVVITRQFLQPYIATLNTVGKVTRDFYLSQVERIHSLLGSTTSGKQGVPDPNMTMHLWRYVRRGICQAMYAKGFFTDDAPETGLITVFFKNDVEYLTRLFN